MEEEALHRHKRNYTHWPKRIILVRHGESLANVDRSIYATVPDNKIGLSERGTQQAQDAGVALREIVGDETVLFYVSPYVRCRMTLAEMRSAFRPEQCVGEREDPRLREQEWGNYQDPQLFDQRMRDRHEVGAFYYRFAEGESGADVYDRVSSFLETLFRNFESMRCAQNVVIVTHGMTLRLFLMRYFHWTVATFSNLWNPANCEIVRLEREHGSRSFRLATTLRSNQPMELPKRQETACLEGSQHSPLQTSDEGDRDHHGSAPPERKE